MANEITLKFQLKADKGGAGIDSVLQQKSLTLTGNEMNAGTQLIPLSPTEATIDLGAVPAAAGYVLIKNMDAANFVELSFTTGGAWATRIKLRAGCAALFQPVGTVYARADTAAVRVQVWTVEV